MRQTEARWPFVLLMVVLNLGVLLMPTAWFTTELGYVAFFGLPILTIIVAAYVVTDSIRHSTREWRRRTSGE